MIFTKLIVTTLMKISPLSATVASSSKLFHQLCRASLCNAQLVPLSSSMAMLSPVASHIPALIIMACSTTTSSTLVSLVKAPLRMFLQQLPSHPISPPIEYSCKAQKFLKIWSLHRGFIIMFSKILLNVRQPKTILKFLVLIRLFLIFQIMITVKNAISSSSLKTKSIPALDVKLLSTRVVLQWEAAGSEHNPNTGNVGSAPSLCLQSLTMLIQKYPLLEKDPELQHSHLHTRATKLELCLPHHLLLLYPLSRYPAQPLYHDPLP